jgi:protein TonB
LSAVADSPAVRGAAVSDLDRLGFTLFLALAIHGVLLLGISFKANLKPPPESQPTIEVTLATQASARPPPKADFIAPVHQQGSGEAEQAQRLTSPKPATTQSPRQQLSQSEQAPARPQPRPRSVPPAVSRASQTAKPVPQRAEPTPEVAAPAQDSTLLERSIEIASLEAELDRQQQVKARRPRVRTISAASTQSSVDAYYLEAWRQKIERVGNLNYPQQARDQQIYGSLRMMVRLLPDGSVDRIQIIESSGHPLLDEAAVRIVRLAEPFAPFPPELSRETDVLQIIRTWRFRNSYSSAP